MTELISTNISHIEPIPCIPVIYIHLLIRYIPIYGEAAWAIESKHIQIHTCRAQRARFTNDAQNTAHRQAHNKLNGVPPSLTYVSVQAWACAWAYGFGTWLLCAGDRFFLLVFFPFPNFYIGRKFCHNGLFFMSYDIFLLRFLCRFMLVRLYRFRR